jgi:hypothetical protein
MDIAKLFHTVESGLDTAAGLAAAFGVPGAAVAKKIIDGLSEAVPLVQSAVDAGALIVSSDDQAKLRELGDRLNAQREDLATQIDNL